MHKLTHEDRIKRIAAMRDQKAADHLTQYAPVWLVDEKPIPEEDAVQFNVVFLHPRYGWVNRRYRYDAFQDVLYHKGQTLVDEEVALQIQEREPYLKAPAINTINSYGG
jgi:hypothetical protein